MKTLLRFVLMTVLFVGGMTVANSQDTGTLTFTAIGGLEINSGQTERAFSIALPSGHGLTMPQIFTLFSTTTATVTSPSTLASHPITVLNFPAGGSFTAPTVTAVTPLVITVTTPQAPNGVTYSGMITYTVNPPAAMPTEAVTLLQLLNGETVGGVTSYDVGETVVISALTPSDSGLTNPQWWALRAAAAYTVTSPDPAPFPAITFDTSNTLFQAQFTAPTVTTPTVITVEMLTGVSPVMNVRYRGSTTFTVNPPAPPETLPLAVLVGSSTTVITGDISQFAHDLTAGGRYNDLPLGERGTLAAAATVTVTPAEYSTLSVPYQIGPNAFQFTAPTVTETVSITVTLTTAAASDGNVYVGSIIFTVSPPPPMIAVTGAVTTVPPAPVESATFTLAVALTPEVSGVSYAWTQTEPRFGALANLAIANADAATATVTVPELKAGGDVSFVVKVSDDDGMESSFTHTATIAADNDAPIIMGAETVRAAGDRDVYTIRDITVSDPEGERVTYSWAITGTFPGFELRGGLDTLMPAFIYPFTREVGNDHTATAILTATDADGQVGTATVTVRLPINRAPTAVITAPAGREIALNERVALAGTGAARPQQDSITGFAWSQVSGPQGAFENADQASATFIAPAALATDGDNDIVISFVTTDAGNDQGDAATRIQLMSVPALVTLRLSATPTVYTVAGVAVTRASATDSTRLTCVITVTNAPRDRIRVVWTEGVNTGSVGPDNVIQDFGTISGDIGHVLTFPQTNQLPRIADRVNFKHYICTVFVPFNAPVSARNAFVHQGPIITNSRVFASAQTVAEDALVTITSFRVGNPDNRAVTYSWDIVDEPTTFGLTAGDLFDADTLMPSFAVPQLLAPATFRLRLNTNNGVGDANGTATITVNADNDAPVVNAGVDQVMNAEETVMLSGVAFDAEDQTLSYVWQQVDAEGDDITTDALTLTPTANTDNTVTFTAPTVGMDLYFELRATDVGQTADPDATPQLVEVAAQTGMDTVMVRVRAPVLAAATVVMLNPSVTSNGGTNVTSAQEATVSLANNAPAGWTALTAPQMTTALMGMTAEVTSPASLASADLKLAFVPASSSHTLEIPTVMTAMDVEVTFTSPPIDGTVFVGVITFTVLPPNNLPTITIPSGLSVAVGEMVMIPATVMDDDTGDVLTIAWSGGGGGTFTPNNTAVTFFTAPSMEGTVMVTLTVNDGRGEVVETALITITEDESDLLMLDPVDFTTTTARSGDINGFNANQSNANWNMFTNDVKFPLLAAATVTVTPAAYSSLSVPYNSVGGYLGFYFTAPPVTEDVSITISILTNPAPDGRRYRASIVYTVTPPTSAPRILSIMPSISPPRTTSAISGDTVRVNTLHALFSIVRAVIATFDETSQLFNGFTVAVTSPTSITAAELMVTSTVVNGILMHSFTAPTVLVPTPLVLQFRSATINGVVFIGSVTILINPTPPIALTPTTTTSSVRAGDTVTINLFANPPAEFTALGLIDAQTVRTDLMAAVTSPSALASADLMINYFPSSGAHTIVAPSVERPTQMIVRFTSPRVASDTVAFIGTIAITVNPESSVAPSATVENAFVVDTYDGDGVALTSSTVMVGQTVTVGWTLGAAAAATQPTAGSQAHQDLLEGVLLTVLTPAGAPWSVLAFTPAGCLDDATCTTRLATFTVPVAFPAGAFTIRLSSNPADHTDEVQYVRNVALTVEGIIRFTARTTPVHAGNDVSIPIEFVPPTPNFFADCSSSLGRALGIRVVDISSVATLLLATATSSAVGAVRVSCTLNNGGRTWRGTVDNAFTLIPPAVNMAPTGTATTSTMSVIIGDIISLSVGNVMDDNNTRVRYWWTQVGENAAMFPATQLSGPASEFGDNPNFNPIQTLTPQATFAAPTVDTAGTVLTFRAHFRERISQGLTGISDVMVTVNPIPPRTTGDLSMNVYEETTNSYRALMGGDQYTVRAGDTVFVGASRARIPELTWSVASPLTSPYSDITITKLGLVGSIARVASFTLPDTLPIGGEMTVRADGTNADGTFFGTMRLTVLPAAPVVALSVTTTTPVVSSGNMVTVNLFDPAPADVVGAVVGVVGVAMTATVTSPSMLADDDLMLNFVVNTVRHTIVAPTVTEQTSVVITFTTPVIGGEDGKIYTGSVSLTVNPAAASSTVSNAFRAEIYNADGTERSSVAVNVGETATLGWTLNTATTGVPGLVDPEFEPIVGGVVANVTMPTTAPWNAITFTPAGCLPSGCGVRLATFTVPDAFPTGNFVVRLTSNPGDDPDTAQYVDDVTIAVEGRIAYTPPAEPVRAGLLGQVVMAFMPALPSANDFTQIDCAIPLVDAEGAPAALSFMPVLAMQQVVFQTIATYFPPMDSPIMASCSLAVGGRTWTGRGLAFTIAANEPPTGTASTTTMTVIGGDTISLTTTATDSAGTMLRYWWTQVGDNAADVPAMQLSGGMAEQEMLTGGIIAHLTPRATFRAPLVPASVVLTFRAHFKEQIDDGLVGMSDIMVTVMPKEPLPITLRTSSGVDEVTRFGTNTLQVVDGRFAGVAAPAGTAAFFRNLVTTAATWSVISPSGAPWDTLAVGSGFTRNREGANFRPPVVGVATTITVEVLIPSPMNEQIYRGTLMLSVQPVFDPLQLRLADGTGLGADLPDKVVAGTMLALLPAAQNNDGLPFEFIGNAAGWGTVLNTNPQWTITAPTGEPWASATFTTSAAGAVLTLPEPPAPNPQITDITIQAVVGPASSTNRVFYRATGTVRVQPTNPNVAPQATATTTTMTVRPGGVISLSATGIMDPIHDHDLTYTWSQTGSNAAMAAAMATDPDDLATPAQTYTAPAVDSDTVLTLQVTVADNGTPPLSVTSSVMVAVNPNIPPTVTATTSTATVASGGMIMVSGTAADPDGMVADPAAAIRYSWTQIDDPLNRAVAVAASGFAGSDTPQTFTAPLVAADTVITLQLTATDGEGGVMMDTVTVTVMAVTSPASLTLVARVGVTQVSEIDAGSPLGIEITETLNPPAPDPFTGSLREFQTAVVGTGVWRVTSPTTEPWASLTRTPVPDDIGFVAGFSGQGATFIAPAVAEDTPITIELLVTAGGVLYRGTVDVTVNTVFTPVEIQTADGMALPSEILANTPLVMTVPRPSGLTETVWGGLLAAATWTITPATEPWTSNLPTATATGATFTPPHPGPNTPIKVAVVVGPDSNDISYRGEVDWTVRTRPNVDAGPAVTVVETEYDANGEFGTADVTLTGATTSVPPGTTVTYLWTVVAGAGFGQFRVPTIINPTSFDEASFVPPNVISSSSSMPQLTFRLRVTADGQARNGTRTVTITGDRDAPTYTATVNDTLATAADDSTRTVPYSDPPTPVTFVITAFEPEFPGGNVGNFVNGTWVNTRGFSFNAFPSVSADRPRTFTFTPALTSGLQTLRFRFNLARTSAPSRSYFLPIIVEGPPNAPPDVSATATVDGTVVTQIPHATAVTLTGMASDPEGQSLSYTWERVDATGTVISGSTAGSFATPDAMMPQIQVYTAPSLALDAADVPVSLRLTVADPGNPSAMPPAAAASSDVTVTVTVIAPDNTPPTVTLLTPHTNDTVNEGDTLRLRATATDPDPNQISSREWGIPTGETRNIFTLAGVNPSGDSVDLTVPEFLDDVTVAVQLVVDDGLTTGRNTINITIRADNDPPTATATTPPDLVASGRTVTLMATGISDPEEQALTYTWVQVDAAGDPVTPATITPTALAAPNPHHASFIAPNVAADDPNLVLRFRLTVADVGRAASPPVTAVAPATGMTDTVTIMVAAEVPDRPPIMTITTPFAGSLTEGDGAPVTLDVSVVDPDGTPIPPLSYVWTLTSRAADIAGLEAVSQTRRRFRNREALEDVTVSFRIVASGAGFTTINQVIHTVLTGDNDAPTAVLTVNGMTVTTDAVTSVSVESGTVLMLNVDDIDDPEDFNVFFGWRVLMPNGATLSGSASQFTSPGGDGEGDWLYTAPTVAAGADDVLVTLRFTVADQGDGFGSVANAFSAYVIVLTVTPPAPAAPTTSALTVAPASGGATIGQGAIGNLEVSLPDGHGLTDAAVSALLGGATASVSGTTPTTTLAVVFTRGAVLNNRLVNFSFPAPLVGVATVVTVAVSTPPSDANVTYSGTVQFTVNPPPPQGLGVVVNTPSSGDRLASGVVGRLTIALPSGHGVSGGAGLLAAATATVSPVAFAGVAVLNTNGVLTFTAPPVSVDTPITLTITTTPASNSVTFTAQQELTLIAAMQELSAMPISDGSLTIESETLAIFELGLPLNSGFDLPQTATVLNTTTAAVTTAGHTGIAVNCSAGTCSFTAPTVTSMTPLNLDIAVTTTEADNGVTYAGVISYRVTVAMETLPLAVFVSSSATLITGETSRFSSDLTAGGSFNDLDFNERQSLVAAAMVTVSPSAHSTLSVPYSSTFSSFGFTAPTVTEMETITVTLTTGIASDGNVYVGSIIFTVSPPPPLLPNYSLSVNGVAATDVASRTVTVGVESTLAIRIFDDEAPSRNFIDLTWREDNDFDFADFGTQLVAGNAFAAREFTFTPTAVGNLDFRINVQNEPGQSFSENVDYDFTIVVAAAGGTPTPTVVAANMLVNIVGGSGLDSVDFVSGAVGRMTPLRPPAVPFEEWVPLYTAALNTFTITVPDPAPFPDVVFTVAADNSIQFTLPPVTTATPITIEMLTGVHAATNNRYRGRVTVTVNPPAPAPTQPLQINILGSSTVASGALGRLSFSALPAPISSTEQTNLLDDATYTVTSPDAGQPDLAITNFLFSRSLDVAQFNVPTVATTRMMVITVTTGVASNGNVYIGTATFTINPDSTPEETLPLAVLVGSSTTVITGDVSQFAHDLTAGDSYNDLPFGERQTLLAGATVTVTPDAYSTLAVPFPSSAFAFTAPTVTETVSITVTLTTGIASDGNVYVGSIIFTVNPNTAPTVTIPSGLSVVAGGTVMIAATAVDAQSDTLTFAWSGGGGGSFSATNTLTTNFVAPSMAGTVMVTLTVSGGGGTPSPVVVMQSITVTANLPPVINLAAINTAEETVAKTITPTVTDADGTLASFAWVQIDGTTATNVAFTTANAAAVVFTPPEALAEYTVTLQLTATDDDGDTDVERVVVTVVANNDPPVILINDVGGLNLGSATAVGLVLCTVVDPDTPQADVMVTWTQNIPANIGYSVITLPTTTFPQANPIVDSRNPGQVGREYRIRFTLPPNSQATGSFDIGCVASDGVTSVRPTIGNNVDAQGRHRFVLSPFFNVNLPPVVTIPDTPLSVVEESRTVIAGVTAADPTSSVLTFAWEIADAGGTGATTAANLEGANTIAPTFIAPEVSADATVMLRLTVTDTAFMTFAAVNTQVMRTITVTPTPVTPTRTLPVTHFSGLTHTSGAAVRFTFALPFGDFPNPFFASAARSSITATVTSPPAHTDVVININHASNEVTFTAPTVMTPMDLVITIATPVTSNGFIYTNTFTYTVNPPPVNTPPTVTFTTRTVPDGGRVTLTVTASDTATAAGALGYSWQAFGGGAYTEQATTPAYELNIGDFLPPATAEELRGFRLVVTDDGMPPLATTTDFSAFVIAAGSTPPALPSGVSLALYVAADNDAPTITVADQTRTAVEGATFTMTGITAADPEEGNVPSALELDYAWTVFNAGGTTLTTGDLTGANGLTPSFTAPAVTAATNLVLRLTATEDNTGYTAVVVPPLNVMADVTVAITDVANVPPTVTLANTATATEGTPTTITATADDPDGAETELVYAWRQLNRTADGSVGTFTGGTTGTVGFTPPQALASYTVTLQVTVTDSSGAAVMDTVTISVTAANDPPSAVVASVSPDTVIGGQQVNLSFTGGVDPEMQTRTILWATSANGAGGSLATPSATTTTYTTPVVAAATTVTVTLRVSDGVTPVMDTVEITVNPPPNVPPVVTLATNETADEGVSKTIAATATDDDGVVTGLTYEWTQTNTAGGVALALVAADTAAVRFTPPESIADYAVTLQLEVTDDDDDATTDTVTIAVSADNDAPTATAVAHLATVISGGTVSLSATNLTDPEGQDLSYGWTVLAAGGGAFTTASAAATDYTAPVLAVGDDAVTVTLRLTVSDVGRTTPTPVVASETVMSDVTVTVTAPFAADAAILVVSQVGDTVASGGQVALNAGFPTIPTGLNNAEANAIRNAVMFSVISPSEHTGLVIQSGAGGNSQFFNAPTVTTDTVITFQGVTPRDKNNVRYIGTAMVTVIAAVATGVIPTVTLSGTDTATEAVAKTIAATAADPDGNDDELTYSWSQVGGMTVSLVDTTIATATVGFTPPQATAAYTVILRLTVTDEDDDINVADVVVSVSAGNDSPTVTATANGMAGSATVASGATVALDETAAADPESQALTYAWAFVGTPDGALSRTTATPNPAVTYTAPTLPAGASDATVTLMLTVSDGAMNGTSLVTLTVTAPAAVNMPPIVSVTPATAMVIVGGTVALQGSADDPDGDDLTVMWTATGGGTFSPTDMLTTTFTAPTVAGVVMVTLTVSDGMTAAQTATAMITVAAAPPANVRPTANAGVNVTAMRGDVVTLDGRASADLDGTLGYAWAVAGGFSVAMRNTAQPEFTVPQSAASGMRFMFTLTVTDEDGATAMATVVITVVVPDAPNVPPTVLDGTATVNEGTAVAVSLTADDADADNGALRYSWEQTAGVAVAFNSGAATLRFSAPNLAGNATLTFRLTVTDARNGTAAGTLTVTITAGNDQPTATTGGDQTVPAGATVILIGTASDPEGGRLTYLWEYVPHSSGFGVALTNANTTRASFTMPDGLDEGTAFQFTFTVRDTNGGRATATTTVRLAAPVSIHTVILPQATRAIASNIAGNITNRIAALRSSNYGFGSGSVFGGGGGRSASPPSRSLVGETVATTADTLINGDAKTLLNETEFAMPFRAAGTTGGHAAIWGGGDYHQMSGSNTDTAQNWDGDLRGVHVGLDHKFGVGESTGADIFGIALSRMDGEFDYGENDQYQVDLVSANPYLAGTYGWADWWATAGYAQGEIANIVRGGAGGFGGGVEVSDIAMRTAGIGVSGWDWQLGGYTGKTHGAITHSATDITPTTAGTVRNPRADGGVGFSILATRIRASANFSQTNNFNNGARLTHNAELGVRGDFGNGDTESGTEFAMGINLATPTRLTFTAKTHVLLTHSTDYNEWGAQATVRIKPNPDGQGINFNLTPAITDTKTTLSTSISYGIPMKRLGNVFGFDGFDGGLLSPFAESNTGVTYGLNFRASKNVEMSLENETTNTESKMLLKGEIGF